MSDTDYTPEICEAKPLEVYMSTDLNNKNKTYDDIAERILHFFGYPAVSVSDLHRNQIYDAISMAVERFYKHAGVVKNTLSLIVDSMSVIMVSLLINFVLSQVFSLVLKTMLHILPLSEDLNNK